MADTYHGISTSDLNRKMDTSTISGTLNIYQKFVQDGLFNSVAPVEFNISELKGLVQHKKSRIATDQSVPVKRSLADEGNIQPPWKRRILNI